MRARSSPALAPSATGWARDHAITATPAAAPSSSAPTRHTRRGAARAHHSANTPTAGISCSVNRSRYTASPATRPLPASHAGPHRPPGSGAGRPGRIGHRPRGQPHRQDRGGDAPLARGVQRDAVDRLRREHQRQAREHGPDPTDARAHRAPDRVVGQPDENEMADQGTTMSVERGRPGDREPGRDQHRVERRLVARRPTGTTTTRRAGCASPAARRPQHPSSPRAR